MPHAGFAVRVQPSPIPHNGAGAERHVQDVTEQEDAELHRASWRSDRRGAAKIAEEPSDPDCDGHDQEHRPEAGDPTLVEPLDESPLPRPDIDDEVDAEDAAEERYDQQHQRMERERAGHVADQEAQRRPGQTAPRARNVEDPRERAPEEAEGDEPGHQNENGERLSGSPHPFAPFVRRGLLGGNCR